VKLSACAVTAAAAFARAHSGTLPAGASAIPFGAARVAVTAHAESFTMAYGGGVRLVLGTDAGTPFNLHGDNARELELMVEAGLSPIEGLLAATRNGADLLGVLEETGTIEPGKWADLVLVRGDATRDVSLIRSGDGPLLVLKGGRAVVDRPAEA
jgi:imidazolonepropionase-like amidohydrolase